jgi:hypothetical protein
VALTTKKVEKVIKFDNAKKDERVKNELESCHATKKGRKITPFTFKGDAHVAHPHT